MSVSMPAALIFWPKQIIKVMRKLIPGHYLAGFLMLACLLEVDSPLVALMPFRSLSHVPKKNKSPTTPHLHKVQRPRQPSGYLRRPCELNVRRETHLVEICYCAGIRPGHQLEASRRQHEILCKRLKANVIITPPFLV